MLRAPQGGPQARLAGELFAAIEMRAWDRLELMVDAEVIVDVHAEPHVKARRNEHIWRSRSLRGRAQLHGYLMELNQAVPALAVVPRATFRQEGHEVIRSDCAGVDGAGSPFDAVTDFSIWQRDGLLIRIDAEIADLAVGEDVIRHGEGDPRRYFRAFLHHGGRA